MILMRKGKKEKNLPITLVNFLLIIKIGFDRDVVFFLL